MATRPPAPSPDERASAFLIAASPRCGGTLLCDALRTTGVAGYPQEILAPWIHRLSGRTWRYRDLDDYLLAEWDRWASPRGVFGCRMMFGHLEYLCARHGTGDWPARFLARLGRPRWVFLRRRDRIAQAISLYRAEHSGLWWDVGEPGIGVRVVPYDRAAIEACRRHVEHSDRGWRAFFAAIETDPIEIWYEDLAADVEGIVERLLEQLGIAPPVPFHCRSVLRRQMDQQTRDWLARFARGD